MYSCVVRLSSKKKKQKKGGNLYKLWIHRKYNYNNKVDKTAFNTEITNNKHCTYIFKQKKNHFFLRFLCSVGFFF